MDFGSKTGSKSYPLRGLGTLCAWRAACQESSPIRQLFRKSLRRRGLVVAHLEDAGAEKWTALAAKSVTYRGRVTKVVGRAGPRRIPARTCGKNSGGASAPALRAVSGTTPTFKSCTLSDFSPDPRHPSTSAGYLRYATNPLDRGDLRGEGAVRSVNRSRDGGCESPTLTSCRSVCTAAAQSDRLVSFGVGWATAGSPYARLTPVGSPCGATSCLSLLRP